MKAPQFWKRTDSPAVKMLRPFSLIYKAVAKKGIARAPSYVSKLPVLCIGNVTMGGSGKTPVVQSICAMLKEAGKNPAVLLRGYGGSTEGPLTVDLTQHDARLVGDEALLHAQNTDAVVSADRVKGAKVIDGDTWHTHIVMDDGLQNPALKKTVTLLVVDGKNPFGNEEIFPAGPLREPVDDAVRRADAMVILGGDPTGLETRFGFALPIFHAMLYPVNAEEFNDRPVIAFAGIGRPEKFFESLRTCDAMFIETHAFADHYMYKTSDMEHLIARAKRVGATLVTTRKDWVRLSPKHRAEIRVLDVALAWQDRDAIIAFLKQKNIL